ncbi:hypothetical protein [Terrisporobacter vanillatitrophus]|uniref:hypothetical protein n=1 Tax=Terrisporobacter vanillatitrophus TaxID=3058402 RepID=UPI003EB946C7
MVAKISYKINIDLKHSLRLNSLGLSIEQIAKGVELTNEQVKDILFKKYVAPI